MNTSAPERFKANLEKIFENIEDGSSFVTLLTEAYALYQKDKIGSTNTCLLLSNHIKLKCVFLDPNVSPCTHFFKR